MGGDSLKWLEVFKAGRRTSSNGLTRDYTHADLDQAVSTYNPDHFKAPLIVTYPAHNTGNYSDAELHKSQLAFGYPEKLRREGSKLMAGFKKISPKIGEWINEGRILGFSSSFYLPNSPFNPYPGNVAYRHAAACGVDPPAVKGMQLPDNFTESLSDFANYSEEQEGVVEFGLDAEVDDDTIESAQLGAKVWEAIREISNFTSFGMPDGLVGIFKDFYQRSRDYCIAEKGVEEAEKVYPVGLLDELAAMNSIPAPLHATTWDIDRLSERISRLELGEQEGNESEWEDRGSQLSRIVTDYSEENDDEMPPIEEDDDQETQFSELRSRVEDLETKARLLEEENSRLTRENLAIAAQRETDRVASFCEQLVRDRQLLPAQKDREIRFILSLDNTTTADYGEEGELTPRKAYENKLLGGRELWSNKQLPIGPNDAPPVYAENLPAGVDPKSAAQTQQVKAYAAEHNISFNEAVDALLGSGALK